MSSVSSKTESSNNWGTSNSTTSNGTTSNSTSSISSNSNSWGSSNNSSRTMGGNNSRGSNLGVMTNNSGAVSDLDRLLGTLGGDGFLAVLNCGDLSHSLANSLAELSWGVNGNLVPPCYWNTVTTGAETATGEAT